MGGVEKSFNREVAHLACDLGAVAVHGKGIERRNGRDPGLAGKGSLPKLIDPDSDRRNDPQPCDDDTCPHLLEILSVTRPLLLTGSTRISQPGAG